jgi:hypothetical protein
MGSAKSCSLQVTCLIEAIRYRDWSRFDKSVGDWHD